MKKIIYFFISWLLIFNFTFAQNLLYLSSKRTPAGLMVGAEVFNQKTNLSLQPEGYNYEWTFPNISLNSSKTVTNTFLLTATKRITETLFLNLKIYKPLDKKPYYFENQKISIPLPKIKLVRKSNGIILPLVSKLNPNDSLTVLTKNFSSSKLNYLWEFNGVFVSNDKEIKVEDLKEKNGTIKIKVSGSILGEKVEDFANIEIE